VAHFRQRNLRQPRLPVSAVIFYRFSDDEWAVQQKPAILEAIRTEAAALP
jgi:hypothetical protein